VTERIKFTVWRDKWLRGDPKNSCLLNDQGCRCCLGFLGQEVDIADRHQLSVGLPHEVSYQSADAAKKWPVGLLEATDADDDSSEHFRESTVCNSIVHINDNKRLTDEERETKLTEQFASVGIDVEFRDGTGPEAQAAVAS
jgi:hypothetical protein